jgi:hypothetical protein
LRGPIQIAGAVEDQATDGDAAIAATGEAVQHRLGVAAAGRGAQFEHGALAEGATVNRRPIKIVGVVEDQAGVGSIAIAATCEAVQHHLGVAAAGSGAELECGPGVVGAALIRGPIQIAGAVEDQAGKSGERAIAGVTGEAVQRHLAIRPRSGCEARRVQATEQHAGHQAQAALAEGLAAQDLEADRKPAQAGRAARWCFHWMYSPFELDGLFQMNRSLCSAGSCVPLLDAPPSTCDFLAPSGT